MLSIINIQRKRGSQMTLITHSYLLVKKYILELASDRTFYKYAEQTGSVDKFILVLKDRHNIPAHLPEDANSKASKTYKKLKRLDTAIKKADNQMHKLYNIEYNMMQYATLGHNIGNNGHEKKWARHNPLAFEAAVLATPFVLVYAMYVLAKDDGKSLQKIIAQNKQRS